jgi:site-specific DNA recombinase
MGKVQERGEIRPGVHEALVSEETWNAVQRLLPTKTQLSEAKKYPRLYPLRGILFCGNCGVSMNAHRAIGRGGKAYPRYRCAATLKRSWADCPVKEVRAELIEEWVANQLGEVAADEVLLDRAIAATNANASEAAKPLVERRAAVEERQSRRTGTCWRATRRAQTPDRRARRRPHRPHARPEAAA